MTGQVPVTVASFTKAQACCQKVPGADVAIRELTHEPPIANDLPHRPSRTQHSPP